MNVGLKLITRTHQTSPVVRPAIINMNSNYIDPKETQEQEAAGEAAAQDQAIEATQDNEEGGSEG